MSLCFRRGAGGPVRHLLPAFWAYLITGGLAVPDDEVTWHRVWHLEVRAATCVLLLIIGLLGLGFAALLHRPRQTILHPDRLRLRVGRRERVYRFDAITWVRPVPGRMMPLLRRHTATAQPLAGLPDLELRFGHRRVVVTGDGVLPLLAALWKAHRGGRIDLTAVLDPRLAQGLTVVGSSYVVRREGGEVVGPVTLARLLELLAAGEVAAADELISQRRPTWDADHQLPAAPPAATVGGIDHPAIRAVGRPLAGLLDRIGAPVRGTLVRPLFCVAAGIGLGLSLLYLTAPVQLAPWFYAGLPGFAVWLACGLLITSRPTRSRPLPPFPWRHAPLEGWLSRPQLDRALVAGAGLLLWLGGWRLSQWALLEYSYPPPGWLLTAVVGLWSLLGWWFLRAGEPWPRTVRRGVPVALLAWWTAVAAGWPRWVGPPGDDGALVTAVTVATLVPACAAAALGWLVWRERPPRWLPGLVPALLGAALGWALARALCATSQLRAGPAVLMAALPPAVGLLALTWLVRRLGATRWAPLATVVAVAVFAGGLPLLAQTERAWLSRWLSIFTHAPELVRWLMVATNPWLWAGWFVIRAGVDVQVTRAALRAAAVERSRRGTRRRYRGHWLSPRMAWTWRCGKGRRLMLTLINAMVPLLAALIIGPGGARVYDAAALQARPLRQAAALNRALAGEAEGAVALVLADPPVGEAAWAAPLPPLTPLARNSRRASASDRWPEYPALTRLVNALAERGAPDGSQRRLLAAVAAQPRGAGPMLDFWIAHTEGELLRRSGTVPDTREAAGRQLVAAQKLPSTDPTFRHRATLQSQVRLARAHLDRADVTGAAAALRNSSSLAAGEALLRQVEGGACDSYHLSRLRDGAAEVLARDVPLAALEARCGEVGAAATRFRQVNQFASRLRQVGLAASTSAEESGGARLDDRLGRDLVDTAWRIAEWNCALQGDSSHGAGRWSEEATAPHWPAAVAGGELLDLHDQRLISGFDGTLNVAGVPTEQLRPLLLDLQALRRLAPEASGLHYSIARLAERVGDQPLANAAYRQFLDATEDQNPADSQPRLMAVLDQWQVAPSPAARRQEFDRRARLLATQQAEAHRRLARLPVATAGVIKTQGIWGATSDLPPIPHNNPPSGNPLYTDGPYWDTFVTAYVETGTIQATPDYGWMLDSLYSEVNCVPEPAFDFLWDFVWYYCDEGNGWEYLGEEYQSVLHTPPPYPRRTKSGKLVDGTDNGDRLRPERGGLLSKHWDRRDYARSHGLDLGGKDGVVHWFPAPDVTDGTLGRGTYRPNESPQNRNSWSIEFRRAYRDPTDADDHSPGLTPGWYHNWDVRLKRAENEVELYLPGAPRNLPIKLPIGATTGGCQVTATENGVVIAWVVALDKATVGTLVKWVFKPVGRSRNIYRLAELNSFGGGSDGPVRRLHYDSQQRLTCVDDVLKGARRTAAIFLEYGEDDLLESVTPRRGSRRVEYLRTGREERVRQGERLLYETNADQADRLLSVTDRSTALLGRGKPATYQIARTDARIQFKTNSPGHKNISYVKQNGKWGPEK